MNFTDTVRQRLSDVNIQESLRVAARDVLAEMGPRIFERGLTPEGVSIGTYSTRPLTIQKTDMSKTSGGVEADGGKAKFFSGGYKQYKESLGRGQNFDMRNFGVMMRDFETAKETYRGKEIVLTFKQDRNQEIVNKDPRMRKAFGMSTSERETFDEVFTFELSKRLFE
ncbi:MAG: hypothetical protein LC664_12890 [Flavobacteriales bacterium]|nr:hypothetical protein [Flavobacteriales bacterium]